MNIEPDVLVLGIAGTVLLAGFVGWVVAQLRFQSRIHCLKQDNNNLCNKISSLESDLSMRKENLDQLQLQFEENKETLRKEFELISQKIFEEKQQTIEKTNKENVKGFRDKVTILLGPLQKQLEGFQSRVNEINTEQTRDRSKLETQINNLSKLNESLKNEAENLANALKNDKKLLGNWGELQVERLLEDAGLSKGHEYKREDSFKNTDGDARRPDFVLYLPDNKHIIIDSKVSLINYMNSVNAESYEEHQHELNAHVQCVETHIKSLASRNYTSLLGINSPDFVFMFMPIEPAYLAAFEADPSLFNKAYENKIAVVTANTLLPILRTVASLWNIEKQNQNTKVLADEAARMYDKLRVFAEKFLLIESQLNTVSNSYEEAKRTLTGTRGLVPMAEKFKKLGIKVNKNLPIELVGDSISDAELLHEGTAGSASELGQLPQRPDAAVVPAAIRVKSAIVES